MAKAGAGQVRLGTMSTRVAGATYMYRTNE
jgi:hypothetical protein